MREKLEKLEKIRRVLGLILPHLQLSARALGAVEKARSIDGRIDARLAAGVDAVRMSLLLTAGEVANACLPESRHAIRPRRPLPRRGLIVAAAAAVCSRGGRGRPRPSPAGSGKSPAPNTILNVTPRQAVPAPPSVSPLHSTFNPAHKATFYSIKVAAAHQGKLIYSWHLAPPKGNASCNKFGSIFGSPNRAVWHHAATDGCTHLGVQHLGTVTVTIRSRYWQCTASFFGTLTLERGAAEGLHPHLGEQGNHARNRCPRPSTICRCAARIHAG